MKGEKRHLLNKLRALRKREEGRRQDDDDWKTFQDEWIWISRAKIRKRDSKKERAFCCCFLPHHFSEERQVFGPCENNKGRISLLCLRLNRKSQQKSDRPGWLLRTYTVCPYERWTQCQNFLCCSRRRGGRARQRYFSLSGAAKGMKINLSFEKKSFSHSGKCVGPQRERKVKKEFNFGIRNSRYRTRKFGSEERSPFLLCYPAINVSLASRKEGSAFP